MNIKQLHEITARLIAEGVEDTEVMMDTATFPESENGTVFAIKDANIRSVTASDDSGPTEDKYLMLVISGEIEWHVHGASH